MQYAGNKIYYSISMGAFDEEEKKGYRVYGYVTNQKLTDPNFVREILQDIEDGTAAKTLAEEEKEFI